MTFWIVTTLMALAVAGFLSLVMLRGRGTGEAEAPAAYDLKVYRDQLKEVDRDLERGVIAQEDADRTRTEISRRILAADAQAAARATASGTASPRASQGAALLLVLAIGGGSLGLYWVLGAPGYGDLGLNQRIEFAENLRLNRPSQEVAERDTPPAPPPEGLDEGYLDLVQQLRETVAERPDDPAGLRLLTRHEFALGNYRDAYLAQARLIEVIGDQAVSDDFAALADMMILTAGGYVSPEAEKALEQALRLDPGNGVARYYVGLMMVQTGRPDRAFRIWNQLLVESPPNAPWVAPVEAQIEDAALRAGVDYQPQARRAPGPTAADIEAAEEMSPEERLEMIEGMVSGLSDRLANEGGPVQDWAQLISALTVLGKNEDARAILGEARERFADDESAQDVLSRTAERVGIAE